MSVYIRKKAEYFCPVTKSPFHPPKENTDCSQKRSAVYKCANKRCSAKRTIETNIPVKHNFKNSKCTECGRKKK